MKHELKKLPKKKTIKNILPVKKGPKTKSIWSSRTVVTSLIGGLFLLITTLISKDKPTIVNNYNLIINSGNKTQEIKMENLNTASIKDTIEKIITNPPYNSLK